MEKRILDRQRVSLYVGILDPAHLGKVSFFTKDISKNGTFILLAKEKCLPVGCIALLLM